MQTDRVRRWLGGVAIAVLLVVPLVASILSPIGTGRSFPWIAATLAGVLAFSLLIVHMLLPTHWLYLLLRGRNLRWHRRLGVGIVALVVAHVAGLYVYSPDDIGNALVLQAATYSRLGVIAAWCMVLTVGLARARHRLPLSHDNWQVVHSMLAVAITGLAVGHVVLHQGTLDGPAEWLLCIAALAAVTSAVVYWHILRPMRRRR